MEDAGQAERLLERLQLPQFRAQLHHQTAAGLLDTAFVSVLQERVEKFRGRCKEVTEKFTRRLEEAKVQENDLAGKLLASQADRDEWRVRFREAESKAAIEHGRSFAAEAKIVVLSVSLESTEKRMEELTRQLKDAEDWANAAAVEAQAAMRRAATAKMATREAKQRRVEAVA